jgi:hypothetical protein
VTAVQDEDTLLRRPPDSWLTGGVVIALFVLLAWVLRLLERLDQRRIRQAHERGLPEPTSWFAYRTSPVEWSEMPWTVRALSGIDGRLAASRR